MKTKAKRFFVQQVDMLAKKTKRISHLCLTYREAFNIMEERYKHDSFYSLSSCYRVITINMPEPSS